MTRDEITIAYTEAANKLLNGELADLHTARVVESLLIKRADWVNAHLTIQPDEVEWAVRIHVVTTAALLGVI